MIFDLVGGEVVFAIIDILRDCAEGYFECFLLFLELVSQLQLLNLVLLQLFVQHDFVTVAFLHQFSVHLFELSHLDLVLACLDLYLIPAAR